MTGANQAADVEAGGRRFAPWFPATFLSPSSTQLVGLQQDNHLHLTSIYHSTRTSTLLLAYSSQPCTPCGPVTFPANSSWAHSLPSSQPTHAVKLQHTPQPTRMPTSDLLHEALNRHARETTSPPLHALSLSDNDDDEIPVRTPLPSSPNSGASTPSGSATSSRSSSPSRRKGGGGAGKPRRDKTKEREKAELNKRTMDPLIKFPGEVSGRIYGELGVDDLLRCGLVCKKWRASQTISQSLLLGSHPARADHLQRTTDYTWYLLLQSLTYVEPSQRKPAYSATNGLPTWLRSESKEDWAARFASIHRRDDLEERDPERDEDGLTMKEERELKWVEENEEAEMAGMDKGQMRAYYKVRLASSLVFASV